MPRPLTRRLPGRTFRPALTRLEDRSTPATFAEAGATLNLDLLAGESVGIVSGSTSYTLTLGGAATWAGTDSANVSGNGTSTLTVSAAGLAAFTNVNLTDSGAGAAVAFNSSGANAYSDNFTLTLDDAPGQVTFNGSSSFGASNLSVTTHRNIVVSNGASVTSTSGNITFSANQQATPTSGNFQGIAVSGSVTSSTGGVSLAGKGGDDAGGNQRGVVISNGVTVGTTGIGGAVVVTGQGGASTGFNNHGVHLTGTTARITSGGGDVTVSGTGGGSGTSAINTGVLVESGGLIGAGGGGRVSVTGQGATSEGSANFGVHVRGVNTQITSSGGAVTVLGTGGGTGANSGGNHGVLVQGAGRVTAGGTAAVMVIGQGGTSAGSPGNYGIRVSNGTITSGGGDVSVSGTGGGAATSSFNIGIEVNNFGRITAGGSGAVSVAGTGGSGADSDGVLVTGTNSAITAGGSGAVSVAGTGGSGADSDGVQVDESGAVTSGGNAALTVNADSVEINGTGSMNAGTGSVTLRPRTAGTRIDLGGADVLTGSPRTLGLTAAELARITAGTLVIGSATAGNLSVTAAVTLPASTAVQLLSGGSVSAPAAGTDLTAGSTSFPGGGILSIGIAGPAPDSGFTRLVAGGAVNLSGVTLALSGGYLPLPGESFTVVSADSVVGTFAGLPNGSSVNFNGVKMWVVYTPTAVTLVANRPPVITSVSVPTSGVGGRPITVSAAATDTDGPLDPLTFTWTVSRNGVPVASGNGATFTFTPAVGGTFSVGLTVTDTAGATATATRTVAVSPPPRVATAVGGRVRMTNPLTGSTAEITPFPGFGGGVRVATADLNGDGQLDVVAAAGPGGGPHVKVFDGVTLTETASFFAFAPNFGGGVYVAAANGRIVVGAGAGGGPHVKVIDATKLGQVQPDGAVADTALLASFFAYDPSFTGGVRVATADTNNDLTLDVVTGAGPGGGPHVKSIDGRHLGHVLSNGQIADAALIGSVFAFDQSFAGGVFVAAAVGKIAVGADVGGGTQVRMSAAAGIEENRIAAYDPSFAGGVRVGFGDVNADGVPDLLTAAGPGGGPHVKAFLSFFPFSELNSFFAGDPLDPSGVFVS